MEYSDILLTTLQTFITAAIPILSGFLIRFLNSTAAYAKEKAKSELAGQYIEQARDAVANAVLYTSQKYVDALRTKW